MLDFREYEGERGFFDFFEFDLHGLIEMVRQRDDHLLGLPLRNLPEAGHPRIDLDGRPGDAANRQRGAGRDGVVGFERHKFFEIAFLGGHEGMYGDFGLAHGADLSRRGGVQLQVGLASNSSDVQRQIANVLDGEGGLGSRSAPARAEFNDRLIHLDDG